MDELNPYIQRWYERGCERGQDEKWDPFDKFFYFWIALVVAATQHGNLTDRHPLGDRKPILNYFRAKRSSVIGAEEARRLEVKKLVRMKEVIAPKTRCRKEVRDAFDNLRAHYDKSKVLEDSELVEPIVEVLNRVRNNLFHGRKTYTDKNDLKVLKAANPILLEILNRCELWLSHAATNTTQ